MSALEGIFFASVSNKFDTIVFHSLEPTKNAMIETFLKGIQAKPLVNGITIYNSDATNSSITVLIDSSIIILSASSVQFPKRIIAHFLDAIRCEWVSNAPSKPAMESFLKQQMSFHNDKNNDPLSMVSSLTSSLEAQLHQNLETVLNRGKALDEISEESAYLLENTRQFQKKTNELRCSLMKQKWMLTILMIIIILVVFTILGLALWFIISKL